MPEELSFREKPRNRKSPYKEHLKEKRENLKSAVIPQKKKKKSKGKKIPVWFNDSDLKELKLLQDLKEYHNPSVTIKESIKFHLNHYNWLRKKAKEFKNKISLIKKEAEELKIPLGWLE